MPMSFEAAQSEDYKLVSVDRAPPPGEEPARDWYRYRISLGPNNIVGYRRGSLKAVKEHVAGVIDQLNERRSSKSRGRVHLPRSEKKTSRS